MAGKQFIGEWGIIPIVWIAGEFDDFRAEELTPKTRIFGITREGINIRIAVFRV
jgi:hypothetical protein